MENLGTTISGVLHWLIIVVIVGVGLFILFKLLVLLNKMYMRWEVIRKHKNGALLKVTLPQYRRHSDAQNSRVSQQKTKSNVAEQMFAELRGIVPSDWRKHLVFRETLSFEIVATATEISFYIFCSRDLVRFVTNTIFAAYPEADISEVEDYFPKLIHNKLSYGFVQLVGPEYAPIRTYETLVSDALNTILNKLNNLKGNEMVAIQTYITPVSGSWRNKAYSYLNYLKKKQTVAQTETSFEGNQKKVFSTASTDLTIDRDAFESVENKMGKKGFLTGIRIISSSPEQGIADSNFDTVARSYSQYDLAPLTSFQPSQFKPALLNFLQNYKLRLQPRIEFPGYKQQFITNTTETASLFHFPGEEIESPKVDWQRYKTSPAPTNLSTSGIFLGNNNFRGTKTRIYQNIEDRRRHFYLVGQTGVGKTEYLKYLFLQDVKNGEGACYIDPHGDAAEDLLQKIPKERIKDVVYFNPGDFEYPAGLNILEFKSEEDKNIIINSFIALLYKLYDPNRTGMMGPMLERTMRNTILTAMSEEGNTLVEVLRLLTNDSFAASKLDKISDPLIKTYWTEQIAKTSDFHKSESIGYYTSKLDRFVSDVGIRNIVGQSKSSFDIADIMNNKKVLIVNLSKGQIGEENMAFLGMILIPKFLSAAMERESIPEDQRKDFYLYVDEFQNFATPDFVNILSEARKYRLNLIVANQYISQIEDNIRDAVFGNVGSLGAFRVGVDDAHYLVNQFAPEFSEFDLVNNGIGNVYLKVLTNGKPSDSFSANLDWQEISTLPKDPRVAKIITGISRIKYANRKKIVEMEIVRRSNLN